MLARSIPSTVDDHAAIQDLRRIPGIGPSIALDLLDLGVRRVADLDGADPEALYTQLCELRGAHQDRCVLYTFRCAVYFAGPGPHDPELLRWWAWKDPAPTTRQAAGAPATAVRRSRAR